MDDSKIIPKRLSGCDGDVKTVCHRRPQMRGTREMRGGEITAERFAYRPWKIATAATKTVAVEPKKE